MQRFLRKANKIKLFVKEVRVVDVPHYQQEGAGNYTRSKENK
jgi:hypothetical protein